MISVMHRFQLRLFGCVGKCGSFRLAGDEVCGVYYRYDDFVV